MGCAGMRSWRLPVRSGSLASGTSSRTLRRSSADGSRALTWPFAAGVSPQARRWRRRTGCGERGLREGTESQGRNARRAPRRFHPPARPSAACCGVSGHSVPTGRPAESFCRGGPGRAAVVVARPVASPSLTLRPRTRRDQTMPDQRKCIEPVAPSSDFPTDLRRSGCRPGSHQPLVLRTRCTRESTGQRALRQVVCRGNYRNFRPI